MVEWDAPNRTVQYKEEFLQLLALYRELKPMRVLEVGVKEGGTLWYWLKYAQPGAKIVGLDEGVQFQEQYQFSEWGERFDVDFTFIKGNSHDAEIIKQVLQHGPYDFVFIDGDHTEAGVRQDYENYTGKVVAFHDICEHFQEENCGAFKLWPQIIETGTGYKEFVNDWNQDECGIGVLFNES